MVDLLLLWEVVGDLLHLLGEGVVDLLLPWEVVGDLLVLLGEGVVDLLAVELTASCDKNQVDATFKHLQ